MKKEKILIIAANDLGKSGVPNVIMQIVRNLSEKYTFDILLTRNSDYYKREFLSYGGKIFTLNELKPSNKIKYFIWRIFKYKKETKKFLKKILLANNYLIIHSFKETDSWLYLKQGKKYGVKKRIIHNNRVISFPKNILKKYIVKNNIRKSIKNSTKLVSVSQQAGVSFFGKKSFNVILNSFEENKFKFLQTNPKKMNIVQVGTFLPLKNQIFTIEVLKLIKEKYNDFLCFFIGTIYDKNYYEIFLSKVRKYNLDNNVKILNFNANQLEIFKDVAFSFIPSIEEGLSLVAIEAQACGIKVFASNTVPKDVDLGNVLFLDLDPKIWAKNFLLSVSKSYTRKKIDTSKFSTKNFIKKINVIYDD